MLTTIRANLSLPRFHNPHTPSHHPISTILRTTKPENRTHFRLHALNIVRNSNNNSAPPPGGNSNNNNGGGDDWEDNNEDNKYEKARYNCNPNGYMDMPHDNIDIKTVVSVGSALLKAWTNICECLDQIGSWTVVMMVAAGCTIAAAAAAVLVFFIFPLL